MKISYSKHARARIKQRGISELEIKNALIRGQKRQWQSYSNTVKSIYTKGGKSLTVIYEQKKERFTIITAYRSIK